MAAVRLDPPRGSGEQVCPEHLLQRPARHQILRRARGERGEPRAHGGHLVADHLVEALTLLRLEVRVVEHVERGLYAGEGCPARLGQLEQLPVASRLRLVLVGDVVEQQDEAGALRSAGRRAHRRQAHAQKMPGGRAGHEARRRRSGVAAPGDPPFHRLERVRDQRAVYEAVDRPPEPDQLGAAGARRPVKEPAVELPRALVVKQDSPVEVADQHALVQLGHQRGELVALLLHVPARLCHQPRHVLLQAAPLAGQPVYGAGQVAERVAPLRNEVGRRGVADQHPRRIREPRRRGDMRRVEPVDGPSRQCGRDQPPEHRQHAVGGDQRPQHGIHGGALSRVQRHSQQHAAESQPHRQGRARREHGQHEAAIELHASMSLTFCIRSRVENGLVT